jgi:LuxR family transcriptional regulator, maltose regulon positive regulatory protein
LLRPRLDKALDKTVDAHPVTVVSAPSGYGKTTAVASWARRRGEAVAWLSLGSADAEPGQLAAGIVESLQSLSLIGESAQGALMHIDPEGDATSIYRQLCLAVQDPGSTIHLVIDDAHRAGTGLSRGVLGLLLERVPGRLRLVLAGTSSLELALSRRRLTDPEAFLSSRDLAFKRTETAAFARLLGKTVDVDALIEHTQGWPIAVRIALGGTRPTREAAGGTDRLDDYVRDHVLASLPEELASFILSTTVCAELTAPLAIAVSGRTDSGVLLEELTHRGIFLDRSYIGDQAVYRWHAVFARQCNRLSAASDAEGLRRSHLRAAEFLEASDPLCCLQHLLAAEQHDRVAEVLRRRWVGLLVDDHAQAVAELCSTLPERYAGQPEILLVLACAEDVLGAHRVARARYQRAARILEQTQGGQDAGTVLQLARLFLLDGQQTDARTPEAVLALLGSQGVLESGDRAAVLFVLGWAELRNRRRPELTQELFSTAAREARAADDARLEERALSSLALAATWAGKNRRAREVLARLQTPEKAETSSWTYYAGGGGATAASYVAYWSAEFQTAGVEAIRAIDSGSPGTSFAGMDRVVLALAAAAAQDAPLQRRAAAELQAMPYTASHGIDWGLIRDTAICVLEEAAGHQAKAIAIAKRHAQDANLPLLGVALSGVLRRAGDPAAALHLLARHQRFMDISYVATATHLTRALAHKRLGEPERAHEMCELAVQVAAAEDIKAPFCDGDLEIRILLSDHLSRRTRFESFITACLTTTRGEGILDALSEREKDVFRLLQTARTTQEIAETLFVSINTVKTHQRSIYRKLGVQSRREAQQLAP